MTIIFTKLVHVHNHHLHECRSRICRCWENMLMLMCSAYSLSEVTWSPGWGGKPRWSLRTKDSLGDILSVAKDEPLGPCYTSWKSEQVHFCCTSGRRSHQDTYLWSIFSQWLDVFFGWHIVCRSYIGLPLLDLVKFSSCMEVQMILVRCSATL